TLILAALFISCGVTRVIGGVWQRFPTWMWWVLDGVATIVLGILLFSHQAGSKPWDVALYIGISAMLRGWSWLLFCFSARNAPRNSPSTRLDSISTIPSTASPVTRCAC